MTLGKRIKAARERLGLRQKDVAEAFGISDKAVSGWERDVDVPDVAKLPQLRKLLKVPYSYLLEGGMAPPPPAAPTLDDLPPDQREMVSGFIESLHQRRGRVA